MSSKTTKKTNGKNIPVWLYSLLALFGMGIIVLVMTSFTPANPITTYPLEISVSQAVEKRTAGAFILDVREPLEWDQVHIPGATLLPLGQLADRLQEIPKDQEVVVVCRSGNRSATARDILLKAGFTTVTSMAGGMNQWQAGGYPTAAGQ